MLNDTTTYKLKSRKAYVVSSVKRQEKAAIKNK